MLGLMACQPGQVAEERSGGGEGKLRVVASFLPLYAHTARVGGDEVELSLLTRAGSGPHGHDLRPEDVKRVAGADLLVINGLGLESWLDDVVKAVGSQRLEVVDTSAGIKDLIYSGRELVSGKEGDEHGHHHDPERGEHAGCCGDKAGANPHVWLDPVLAQAQVRAIERALVGRDPARAEIYRRNAADYVRELEELDERFQKTCRQLSNRNLVTLHNAFPYMARRYGLNLVGYVHEFPEKEPAPGELKALHDVIKRRQVGVIFVERGYRSRLMEVMAEQTGARIAELDTLEVGEPGPQAYLEGMRRNLAALQAAGGP